MDFSKPREINPEKKSQKIKLRINFFLNEKLKNMLLLISLPISFGLTKKKKT